MLLLLPTGGGPLRSMPHNFIVHLHNFVEEIVTNGVVHRAADVTLFQVSQ